MKINRTYKDWVVAFKTCYLHMIVIVIWLLGSFSKSNQTNFPNSSSLSWCLYAIEHFLWNWLKYWCSIPSLHCWDSHNNINCSDVLLYITSDQSIEYSNILNILIESIFMKENKFTKSAVESRHQLTDRLEPHI